MEGSSSDVVGAVSGTLAGIFSASLRPAEGQKLQREIELLRCTTRKRAQPIRETSEAEGTVLSEQAEVNNQLVVSQSAYTGASRNWGGGEGGSRNPSTSRLRGQIHLPIKISGGVTLSTHSKPD